VLKSKLILLADDNSLSRNVLERILEPMGTLKTSTSLAEVEVLVKVVDFDLILLQLHFSGAKEFTSAKKIKSLSKAECPILAISSSFSLGENQMYFNLGFDALITKPIRPKEVILQIQPYLTAKAEAAHQVFFEELATAQVISTSQLTQLQKFASISQLKEIYDEFLQECRHLVGKRISTSPVAIEEELLREIHSLKGNAGTLGAEKLYTSAKYCESLGRQNKEKDFNESLFFLKNAILEFEEYFNKESGLKDE
jgi:CheY-like chemotaxis protein